MKKYKVKCFPNVEEEIVEVEADNVEDAVNQANEQVVRNAYLERNEQIKKFVYEDNKITKVIKGYIISETEFEYKIKAEHTGAEITIGKRAIVKVCDVGGGA